MEKKCANCGNGKWRDGVTAITSTCTECRYVDKEGQPQPSNWKPKTKTNADNIRAMSDGELADWMAEKFVIETCLRLKDQGYEPTETQKAVIHRTLYHTWLKWLKQPVEDQL